MEDKMIVATEPKEVVEHSWYELEQLHSTSIEETTFKKMAMFLDFVASTGVISNSAGQAGLDRPSLYDYRHKFPPFKRAWERALRMSADTLEDEATRRAVQGVNEPIIYKGRQQYEINQDGTFVLDEEGSRIPLCVNRKSDLLIMFLLKGRRPIRFRDNSTPMLPAGIDDDEIGESQEAKSILLETLARLGIGQTESDATGSSQGFEQSVLDAEFEEIGLGQTED